MTLCRFSWKLWLISCVFPAAALAADLGPAPAPTPTTAPATEPAVINVRDFGAKGDGIADDAPAINHAIAVAGNSNPGAVVFIPAGRYRLEPTPGRSDDLSISHAHGLTVRGETGTVLVARDGDAQIFGLLRCRNITLSTLTLEQEKTWFTQGVIDAVDSKAQTCDVTIDPHYDDPDSPDLANVGSFRPFINSGTTAYQPGRAFAQIKSRERRAARKWHLTFVTDNGHALEPGLAGKKFIIWDQRRRSHAVAGSDIEDCLFEDVTCYGRGANSAFCLGNCRGAMTFRRCVVSVPPGSDDLISCGGGVQLSNFRGSLVFDKCTFDKVDDDAVAVFTPYIRVVAQIDPHTLQLQRNPGYEAGDTLSLVDWAKKAERGPARVTSIALKPDRSCVVTLDRDVQILHAGAGDAKPIGADARGDGIDRVVDYSLACQNAAFRDCRMQSLRARAINLKAQNCLIEGCTFYDCEMPAIAAGAEFTWGEGPAIHNLTIRNNHFINCNTNNIDIDSFDADKDCNAADNRAILIEGNTFGHYGAHATTHHYLPGCAVHIKNSENVTIRNNTFGEAGPGAAKDAAKVVIERSRGVSVGKNEGLPETAIQRK